MQEEVYSIIDVNGYASEMRRVAADSISDSSNEDLNQYISLQQIINLVNERSLGFDDNGKPLLNEEANQKIFEEITIWIHNVGLSKLAGKDMVECAWDNELDDMVFWVKD